MAKILPGNVPPDVNRGPMAIGVVSVAFTLATVFVALRIYVRWKKHAHGWDDFMIYFAWVRPQAFHIAPYTLTPFSFSP